MTSIDDPGRRIAAHFRREAPPRAPAGLLASTLSLIETTPQRRALQRLRVLPRPSWRFPVMNMFAKLAVSAAAIALGAVAVAGILGGGSSGPAAPMPLPATPTQVTQASPSPLAAATATPSPTPPPTTIGAVTLTTTSCEWAGDTKALPDGRIQIPVVNATSNDASLTLFFLRSGHTYDEMATILNDGNSAVQADPTAPIASFPYDIAVRASYVQFLRPGQTGNLVALIPAGSVGGIGCFRGDVSTDEVYAIYPVGPLEFK